MNLFRRKSHPDTVAPALADPAALVTAGFRSHQSGDFDAARTAYEQALKLDPRHSDALYLVGMLDLAGGAVATALTRFDAAIAQAPGQEACQY